MNLVADPILTPTEDKKDANNAPPATRKREKTVLIESKLETKVGTPSIRLSGGVYIKVLSTPTSTLIFGEKNFSRKKIFECPLLAQSGHSTPSSAFPLAIRYIGINQ